MTLKEYNNPLSPYLAGSKSTLPLPTYPPPSHLAPQAAVRIKLTLISGRLHEFCVIGAQFENEGGDIG